MPSTWLICSIISFLRTAGEKSQDQGMHTLVVGEGQVPGSQGSTLCFILRVKALKTLTPFTRVYKGTFCYGFLKASCGIFIFAIEIKFKTKEDLLSSVLYTVKDGIHVVLITYKFRILSFSGVPSHLSYQIFAWVLLYLIILAHERIYSFVDLFIAADRNRKLEIMKDLCDNLFC